MKEATQQGVKVGRKRVYESDAARRAAFLERKGLVQLNVMISADCAAQFADYVKRHQADGAGMTRGQILEKLICAQLLRKR